MSDHIVVNIDVKKVTETPSSSGAKREVLTVARVVVTGSNIELAFRKAQAHLALIDEDGGDIGAFSN